MATLVLELALTRLFSVVFFYHFAFLAISLALFGLGAGGAFSYVVAKRAVNISAELGRLSFLNAVSIVLLLWFILSRHGEMTFWTLAGVYAASAVPFFFAGTVVSLAISEAVDRIGRAYFFDLTGAAAGCLVLIPFLDLFGGPNTVLTAGVLYGIAAAFWFNRAGDRSLRALSVLVALLLVTLMVVNGANRIFDVHWSKGAKLPEERIAKWNSFSRVAVSRNKTETDGYWNIVIDGDAATAIPAFDWDKGLGEDEKRKLLYQGPGLAYLLRPGAKTLIIGAGGGYDIARALAGGSRDVTAVEINPIIANTIMRGLMVRESGGLYLRPEVRVAVEDGRSYVRRSRERYQVLQATLVDTWASTAAGAFALSENNLYTSDAFADYLAHLTSDGMLSFTRWGFEPPRESLRLVSLAMEALRRHGETNAARHVIAVREKAEQAGAFGALDTILISRRPFPATDIERARAVAAEAGMELLYAPGERTGNAFAGLLVSADPRAFWRSYPYDISPVSDDRPFFFFTVQPRDVLAYVRTGNRRSADFKLNQAVPLLFSVMLVSLLATGLILALPRWLVAKPPAGGRLGAFRLYFFCLGAGYILTQLALIQKFIVLLGRPTYALAAVVFTMLVASGAGSLASGRAIGVSDRRLRGVLGLVALLIAVLAFASSLAASAAAGWPVALRLALTAAFVAPVAFFMGMPFPAGLQRLHAHHPLSVRWAWAVNAASSVTGSVLSVGLAIYWGLSATMFTAAGLYLAALLVVSFTGTARRA